MGVRSASGVADASVSGGVSVPVAGGSLVGCPFDGVSVGGLDGEVGVRVGQVCCKCKGRALLSLDHIRTVAESSSSTTIVKKIGFHFGFLFMVNAHSTA